MTDASVSWALRSDAPLVVVEAPAGCGKTYQGADYAQDIAPQLGDERLLVLTHTHAACSVIADRIRGVGSQVEVRTIDSVIGSMASAYHAGLGLPKDTAAWVRGRRDGFSLLAGKVADLLDRHPMIARTLARRYSRVLCDEHQDSSGDQHAVVMALHGQGAKVRIFADPMQTIFREATAANARAAPAWTALMAQANIFETLDTPHRWQGQGDALGAWILSAREILKAGGQIDLRRDSPPALRVVYAENQPPRNLGFDISRNERRAIDLFERNETSLLVLTPHNKTAVAIRAWSGRRLPLWEGHVRNELDRLVQKLDDTGGDPVQVAQATVEFLNATGTGCSMSAFGNFLLEEVRTACSRNRSGRPAKIQSIARHLIESPDHRGVAEALKRLGELAMTDAQFDGVKFDHPCEFLDAISLGSHQSAAIGHAAVTGRRAYLRPLPPRRAISTIHKAKGLEREAVILMPVDAQTFPDTEASRCLLYVALSRAKTRLMLVVSRQRPSPLFIV